MKSYLESRMDSRFKPVKTYYFRRLIVYTSNKQDSSIKSKKWLKIFTLAFILSSHIGFVNSLEKTSEKNINNQEVSPGGATIYRYESPNSDWEKDPKLKEKIQDSRDKITAHVEKHIGKISKKLPILRTPIGFDIDLLVIAPTPEKNYYTLVTSGMSNLPMTVKDTSLNNFRFIELVMGLPANWPVSDEDLKREENFWPFSVMRILAALPQEFNTWLSYMHTIPNGPDKVPPAYANNTKMNGLVLLEARTLPEEHASLEINPSKTILFLGVYPLYQEEMELKLEKGTQTLEEKLLKNKVTEVLDVKRPNVAGSI